MFRELYSDRLTRGQLLTHQKKSQMCHTNRVEMHINTDIGKNETTEASQ